MIITCEKLNCGSYVPQQTSERLTSSHQNIRAVTYRLRVAESRLGVKPVHSQYSHNIHTFTILHSSATSHNIQFFMLSTSCYLLS